MGITVGEYETFRAWLVAFIEHAKPDYSAAIAALDAMAIKSPANARKGLQMAIGDSLEMSADWDREEVAQFDAFCWERQLPTLTEIRPRFMKQITRVIKRGFIRSEAEYYLIRNAVEGMPDDSESLKLWTLLTDYEEKISKPS
ncbi:hypothetical protein [Mesorhizobium sp. CN2-181]|uniref:hypothetical protein n=1 Tax=Mesorhizobium yinganensis TaxID=3157707 RepID=UPI0032B8245A